MTFDWGLCFTIFIAVIVARLLEYALLRGNSGTGTKVGAETKSEARPIIVYKNEIEQYLHEHYPNAR